MNFIILAVTSIFWFYGIMALIIYSVILYFILKKYFNEIKKNYHRLLEATNEIADGNLDVEIDENLGVFEPFKEEIEKIQTGFKKAVDEEVKSQRMKTELVTNVSHDLKTPLTAIITYVNLLKMEHDPERQKEYIDVLDRKSLRLKALIEDLFEISKASSRSVNLNLFPSSWPIFCSNHSSVATDSPWIPSENTCCANGTPACAQACAKR